MPVTKAGIILGGNFGDLSQLLVAQNRVDEAPVVIGEAGDSLKSNTNPAAGVKQGTPGVVSAFFQITLFKSEVYK